MLAGLDPLVILYMPCDGTQDDLLHQLPWYQASAPVFLGFCVAATTTQRGLWFTKLGVPSVTRCSSQHPGPFPAVPPADLPPKGPFLLQMILWGVVESDKVSPQPPFLQAEQPQFPQPLPISLVLQILHQLRCPSLDTLQPLNVSLVVRGPKLNTGFNTRCGLISAEYRGMITSLVLLATLFLIQARMPLAFLATWAHCWLIFSRLSTNPPRITMEKKVLRDVGMRKRSGDGHKYEHLNSASSRGHCWQTHASSENGKFKHLNHELVHKELGGDTAGTADPNCPKGYSTPHGVMLSMFTMDQMISRGPFQPHPFCDSVILTLFNTKKENGTGNMLPVCSIHLFSLQTILQSAQHFEALLLDSARPLQLEAANWTKIRVELYTLLRQSDLLSLTADPHTFPLTPAAFSLPRTCFPHSTTDSTDWLGCGLWWDRLEPAVSGTGQPPPLLTEATSDTCTQFTLIRAPQVLLPAASGQGQRASEKDFRLRRTDFVNYLQGKGGRDDIASETQFDSEARGCQQLRAHLSINILHSLFEIFTSTCASQLLLHEAVCRLVSRTKSRDSEEQIVLQKRQEGRNGSKGHT
ncbi:hypothetical protein QYF61_019139 [Mycteria americana]|uniref:Uncharacterized protein n=1 Tax=Mycteria americana TaxID=33587 RepID=A0AAN7NF67_MYCAM|nr:hypothetical protein QYF61_019139 [Mycteria americana]